MAMSDRLVDSIFVNIGHDLDLKFSRLNISYISAKNGLIAMK